MGRIGVIVQIAIYFLSNAAQGRRANLKDPKSLGSNKPLHGVGVNLWEKASNSP